jgi:hypothetical protein
VRAGRLGSGQARASLCVMTLDSGAATCVYRLTSTSGSR